MGKFYVTLINVIFFWSLIGISPVKADENTLNQAKQFYALGRFDEAYDLAQAHDTSEALTLSAEILSAKTMLGHVEDHKKTAKRAIKHAKKAIKDNPDLDEAYVQHALALGFRTQASSPFTAWSKGLPEKTRRAIDIVRDRTPEDPRADALLGAWNLGIVRKAGHGRAKDMYSASEQDGILYYEQALKKKPGDIIIMSNYAVSLLVIDLDKHKDNAFQMIQAVDQAMPINAVEIEVQSRIRALAPHFEDPEQLISLSENFLDGEKLGY